MMNLSYKITLDILYPIIQLVIGIIIVGIQNDTRSRNIKAHEALLDRTVHKSPVSENSERQEYIRKKEILDQMRSFKESLYQNAWNGFGWGLIATSIFLFLIIFSSDHYSL